jgi:hypothetical protein
MLEDGLLMIAVHVVRLRPVTHLLQEFHPKARSLRFEMYDDLDTAQRKELYRTCRENLTAPKLIVSVFEGSSIFRQLPVLKKYKCEIEVCKAVKGRKT